MDSFDNAFSPEPQSRGRHNTFDGIFITTGQVLKVLKEQNKGSGEESSEQSVEVVSHLSEEEELNPQVEQFKEDLQYYLCCCGYFVGFGNIIVFPHLLFDNGGAAFLIPFTISMLLVAVPVFILETAWGQLIRSKLDNKFAMANSKLWGIGLAMTAINWLTLSYYAMLFPWTLSFFFDSFRRPLPWAMDNDQWNQRYFKDDVLQVSDGISEPMHIVLRPFIYLVLAYVILYFTVWKGLSTSSQVVYLTVPVPCFLLAIFILKGITLEGSELGLYYLFVPEWDRLFEPKIWEKALTQSIFQTGLVYGSILLYATARKPNSPIIKSSIYLPFVDYFLSLMGAIAIFTFLGHIAHKEGKTVKEITSGGLDLAFIAYPGLITTLSMPNFWSFLFFLMLLLIGVDTVIGLIDFESAFAWDFFQLRKKMKKQYVVLIIVGSLFFTDIFLATNNGWYYFVLISKHAGGITVIFTLFAEIYCIAFVFGLDKLEALMHHRTGETIPKPFKFSLKYLTLPLIGIIFCISVYREFAVQTNEPTWQIWVGRFLISIPIASCLIGFCIKRKTPTAEALVQRQFGMTIKELVEKFNAHQQKVEETSQDLEITDQKMVSRPEFDSAGDHPSTEAFTKKAQRYLARVADS